MNNKTLESNETTEAIMLTTIDNPFNPFTQWDEWFQFDTLKGYNTCGLLARIAKTSDELSESENEKEVDRAIDSILNNVDFIGLYRKVKRNDKITSISLDSLDKNSKELSE